VDEFSDIKQVMALAKKRHPKIRAFYEDDHNWMNNGLDALKAAQPMLAENTFQKLILAQPDHCDGYEGYARVCFATGRLRSAQTLMDHAHSLAKASADLGETDPEIVQEMDDFRREIDSALKNQQ